MQCAPELARWHARRAMAAFALEDMHDVADPIEAAPGILGLAVPDAPAQALDLGDDHGFRLHSVGLVGRQSARRLLRVLEPHGDVESVENRRVRDPGIGQNRPQTGAAIGERGQLRVVNSADRLQASADQHRDVGIGPRDGAVDLPAPVGSLDIADPNFEMPFAVIAATDEGRIHGDGDGRRGRLRLDRGGVTKLLTDLERMAAESLGALAGLDRQKIRQHAGGDTKGHEGGKMRSQLIQLRRRPTMRWPADTSLGTTTAGAAKPREPHRHRAEQRRHLMQPPVLDVTPPATGRALRPRNRMIVGLRGHHRLLDTRQDLLCLGQRQPQIRNVAKVVGPADLHHVDTSCPVVSSRSTNCKSHLTLDPPAGNDPTGHIASEPGRRYGPAHPDGGAGQEILGVERIAVVADRGYFKIEDIEACEKAGMERHVPRPQRGPSVRAGLYRKDEFQYDPESDTILCPGGHRLQPYPSSFLRGLKKINYANKQACRDCPLRSRCTNNGFRSVSRMENEAVLDRLQARLANRPEVLRQRREAVEHPFGTIKEWMDQGAFLMRGLEKVRGEFSLTALAYDLRRVLNIVGFNELMAAVQG